jgi:hypothetical protein
MGVFKTYTFEIKKDPMPAGTGSFLLIAFAACTYIH